MFRQNLVSFEWDDLSTWVNVGPNTDSASFTFDRNLWYAYDSPSQSEPTLPVTESNGIYGVEPIFTTDYQVSGASPAVAAGVPTQWTWGDLCGRCFADQPTIGAYEVR